MSVASLKEFIKLESAAGIILVVAALLALLVANSPLSHVYDLFLSTHFEIRIGTFSIDKALLLWINDGLMAIFFFLVGLEIKREVMEGQLSSRDKLMLPLLGAIGGIFVPAVIYSAFNWGDGTAMSGWAIPAATDIAFALGVMALLGSRVPGELKLMLLAIAIIDDLGAIGIIALFYTEQVSASALIAALVGVVGLATLNRCRVKTLAPYVLIGFYVWVCVLKSGVHATLAGVLVAAFVPLRVSDDDDIAWTEQIEHALHPWVAFLILPVFAFANAGLSLSGLGLDALLHPISLGIALGLVLGKQIGVFGAIWLAIRFGFAKLPKSLGWGHLYGMASLCGIGFTMSLFIGSLAFQETGNDNFVYDRIGILVGSLIASLFGYGVLRLVGGGKREEQGSVRDAVLQSR